MGIPAANASGHTRVMGYDLGFGHTVTQAKIADHNLTLAHTDSDADFALDHTAVTHNSAAAFTHRLASAAADNHYTTSLVHSC